MNKTAALIACFFQIFLWQALYSSFPRNQEINKSFVHYHKSKGGGLQFNNNNMKIFSYPHCVWFFLFARTHSFLHPHFLQETMSLNCVYRDRVNKLACENRFLVLYSWWPFHTKWNILHLLSDLFRFVIYFRQRSTKKKLRTYTDAMLWSKSLWRKADACGYHVYLW